MSIVDRGRDDRRPRSQWPADRHWRSPSRFPEAPSQRPAPAIGTYVLAALCIAVFAYGYLSGTRIELDLIRDYAFVPADLKSGGGNGYLGLATHMFLHGDWVHLLVNMIVLLSFGRALEPALGTGRFVLLYLVAGVAAAYGHAALTGFPDTPMIGASGATAGIVGAAALAAPRMPVIFFILPMPLFAAVIVLVALHAAAIYFEWDPGIAWWAHLVGLVAGAVLFPLLRRRTVR